MILASLKIKSFIFVPLFILPVVSIVLSLTIFPLKWSNRGVGSWRFLKTWLSPWRAYVAEFLGTFVFVFISSGAVLTNIFFGEVGLLGVALVTGLSITTMMLATVNISGGHLNPAVTLALWLSQKVRGTVAVFYMCAQILASFTAAGLLLFFFGTDSLQYKLGGPALGAGISDQTGLVIEATLTAILVFVVFATLVDKRGSVSFGPLAVGLIVLIAGVFAGPLTGAVLNPARALGPLLISGSSDITVWIVGPATGALFGLVYDFLFLGGGRK